MPVAFDTLKAAQRLSAVGFSEEQAATIAATFAEGITENLATKDDVALLQKDIKALNSKIDNSVAALNSKIDNSGAALNSKIDNSVAALNSKIDNSGAALNSKIDNSGAALNSKIDNSVAVLEDRMDVTVANAKFDLTWRLLGGVALINGLMFALIRYMPPPG